MGRKRKAGVMLPKHVHVVKRPSGAVNYYWSRYRGTARAEKPVPLPDPSTTEFWEACKRLAAREFSEKAGTMADMIDAYLVSPRFHKLAANTKREYRRHMALLRKRMLAFDAGDMEPHHVAEMRDDMGHTPAKANAFIKAISSLYQWGCERGFARENPAVKITKLEIGEYKPWTPWAWETALKHFRPEIVKAIILGRETSQRLGDVLAMSRAHLETGVDEASGLAVHGIRVVQQKTGTSLFVPLTPAAMAVVEQARLAGHLALVAKPSGEHFTVDQFHAMWGREMSGKSDRCLELAKIRAAGLSFHGLRKAFVVEGAERGLSSKLIGAVTGQSSPVVEHYAKGADQKKLAIKAMSTLREGTK